MSIIMHENNVKVKQCIFYNEDIVLIVLLCTLWPGLTVTNSYSGDVDHHAQSFFVKA